MTAVVVGASSGLGRALCEQLARNGKDLLLVASDPRDLAALAADLNLRHAVQVGALALDLATSADPGARILQALDGLPAISALLLPVGMSRPDDDGSLPASAAGQILAINLHAPMAIVESLLPQLLESRGVVVGFGSVAAVRGRSKNIVYAAAKRGLQSFFESLRHRHAPDRLRVQFYRLGFLRSNLTHGMSLPLPVAEPEQLARQIVTNLKQGSFDRHAPRWWALVTFLIAHLPWFVFRRMQA